MSEPQLLDKEIAPPTRHYPVVLPKHEKIAGNKRVWKSRYRGFGQMKLSDGRFAMAFSTVGSLVWSLMGNIHCASGLVDAAPELG